MSRRAAERERMQEKLVEELINKPKKVNLVVKCQVEVWKVNLIKHEIREKLYEVYVWNFYFNFELY